MKFRIKKIKLCKVIFAVLIPGLNLFAQANSSAIIENSLQAIGGRKEIAKIQNFRAVADCAGPNGNYTTEIYSAKNERLIFKQIKQNGDIYQGQTNGQIFWTKDEKIDDFALANEKAVFAWRTHEFQSLAMGIDRRFRDFVLADEENFGGKPAVKLNAIDELGKPASIYFDKDSSLMLGFVIQNPFNARAGTDSRGFQRMEKNREIKPAVKNYGNGQARRFCFEFPRNFFEQNG